MTRHLRFRGDRRLALRGEHGIVRTSPESWRTGPASSVAKTRHVAPCVGSSTRWNTKPCASSSEINMARPKGRWSLCSARGCQTWIMGTAGPAMGC